MEYRCYGRPSSLHVWSHQMHLDRGVVVRSGNLSGFNSSGQSSFHITVKELIPLVIAAAVWGRQWGKQHVQFKCDNSAVVAIINGGYSKDREIMHLMRCLHFLSARFHFRFTAEHINTAADALSRDSLSLFQELLPTANNDPTQIPSILRDLLMIHKPDWMSTNWTALFNSYYLSQSIA